jgi:hypothetical protein
VLLCIAIAAGSRESAWADERARLDDPFPVRNQLPLGLPFLEEPPRSAFLLAPGIADVSLGLAYETTLSASDSMVDLYREDDFRTYDGLVTQAILEGVAADSSSDTAYYLDGETLRAVLSGRLGLNDRLEIGLEIPLLLHTRGFLDSPIDSYHAFFGFPDGGRTAFARDQYVIGYSDDGRTVFLDDSPPGLRIGDLVVSGRAGLVRGGTGRSALTASLAAKLPTGSIERFDGSGHADFALGLQASWRFERATLHAGGGYSRLGTWSLEPGFEMGDRTSLFLTWAWRATPRSGIVVQVLGGGGPFPHRDDGSLGHPALEIAAGMRHEGGASWTIEWALLENLTRDLNVPDFGLFFGVSRRFAWRKGAGSGT